MCSQAVDEVIFCQDAFAADYRHSRRVAIVPWMIQEPAKEALAHVFGR